MDSQQQQVHLHYALGDCTTTNNRCICMLEWDRLFKKEQQGHLQEALGEALEAVPAPAQGASA